MSFSKLHVFNDNNEIVIDCFVKVTVVVSAVELDAKLCSTKIIFCTWLLMSLVIAAAYTGKLVSNAVPVQPQLPFTSLKELVDRNDYTWGMGRGGSIAKMFSVSVRHQL